MSGTLVTGPPRTDVRDADALSRAGRREGLARERLAREAAA
ncbi:hypothetical protein OHB07_17630 [Streptomyces sp. NBC_00111]|nr:hypothetical protein [Streptomyces sp. NBC_01460]